MSLEDIHKIAYGGQDVLFDMYVENDKLRCQPKVDNIIETRVHKIDDNIIIQMNEDDRTKGISNISITGSGQWVCELQYSGQRLDIMTSETSNVIWQTQDDRCIPFMKYHRLSFNFIVEFGAELTLKYDIVNVKQNGSNDDSILNEHIVCCHSYVLKRNISENSKIDLVNCNNPLFEIYVKTNKPVKSVSFYTHTNISFPLAYDKINDRWRLIIQERGINDIIVDNKTTINPSRLDRPHIYIKNDRKITVYIWSIYANFVRRLAGMMGYAYAN
jgi:hypothetical protein